MVGRIMNDLFWALYWIDILSGFNGQWMAGTFLGCCLTGGLGALLGAAHADNKQLKYYPLWMPITGITVGIILSIVMNFVPSKQTMYLMLGVKTTENVMESDMGKKLESIVDAELNDLLKKYQPKEQK
jgi:hypothetical protein